MPTNKTIEEIKQQVETEYQLGGLSTGLYGDYASEVAIRYARTLLEERIERVKGMKDSINFKNIVNEYSQYLDERICFDDGWNEALSDILSEDEKQLKELK